MPKYKVKSPLTHDGADYAIGASVEMNEKQAEPMLGSVLCVPGQDLTGKEVSQGVVAVQAEAIELAELREQLNAEQLALEAALADLAEKTTALEAAQSELKAAQDKLAVDVAAHDKAVKANAAKK